MRKSRILLATMTLASMIVMPVTATAGDHISFSSPIWTWGEPIAGKTKLVRTSQGLTAQFKTTGLPAGHAMTMWIMFFDNPEACEVAYACNPAVDIGMDFGRGPVRFDFHYAAGHVVNGAQTTLSGHLQVGELSTSGFAELVEIGGAPPSFVTPLTNPMGAHVILAIHSHGPAQTGTTLAEQMSSYLGGCVLPFLGPGGFAASAGDIPANAGECSTIQLAFHNP